MNDNFFYLELFGLLICVKCLVWLVRGKWCVFWNKILNIFWFFLFNCFFLINFGSSFLRFGMFVLIFICLMIFWVVIILINILKFLFKFFRGVWFGGVLLGGVVVFVIVGMYFFSLIDCIGRVGLGWFFREVFSVVELMWFMCVLFGCKLGMEEGDVCDVYWEDVVKVLVWVEDFEWFVLFCFVFM